VHDRLTSFCVACGTRQAASPSCRVCRRGTTEELRDPVHAATLFHDCSQRTIAAHEKEFLLRAPSVRKAPLHFALGAGVTLGTSFGLPLLMLNPLAGIALAGGSFLCGALGGLAISGFAPKWLLGTAERSALAEELAQLAGDHFHARVDAHYSGPTAGLETRRGTLEGTPAVSPFSPEPVLAAHVVGRYGAIDVDDVWVAPGGLRVSVPSAREGEAPSAVQLEPDVRAWWRTDELEDAPPRLPSETFDTFFAARGASLVGEAREQAMSGLLVRLVRPGAAVLVLGRPSLRRVTDGYRGTRDVVELEGPFVITCVRPRESTDAH
jgi:hypothetical protein